MTMRLELTRRSDLATRALLELSLAESRLKSAALAERVGTSAGFLSQAMTPLVSQGWVHSDPGPTGGYSLAVDPADLNVLEVIEAIEGPSEDGKCVLADRPCEDGFREGSFPCALHQPWSRARTQLLAELSGTALSSLLPQESQL